MGESEVSKKVQRLMEEFYGDDRAKAQEAQKKLIEHGEELLNEGKFEDYQKLVKGCAGIIAEKGITVNDTITIPDPTHPSQKLDASQVSAPIKLMQEFEKQAKDILGEDTEHAEEVKQTRQIVEKTVTVLCRQRQIMEKVGRDPSSVEGFLKALEENNKNSQKAIEAETDRSKHFKEYFPDEASVSTINPNAESYKDSQYDKVDRYDRQMQILADLEKTYEELKNNETERLKYQRQVDVDGIEDAKANVEACKRKEQALKEKISKKTPDGRSETGLIQRLKDLGMSGEDILALDPESADSYETKLDKVKTVLESTKKDRLNAYKDMAKTVVETLEAKGVVDATSKRYPASKSKAMITEYNKLLSASSKKDGPDLGEDSSEENLEGIMKDLKGYVKYVKDEIQMSQDKISEYESAIQDRNSAKTEIEEIQKQAQETNKKLEDRRNAPITEEQKSSWLDESIDVGGGRTEVAKDYIKQESRRRAEGEYANAGRNPVSKWFRNVGFFFKNGFKTRNKMISERAESLETQERNNYVNRRNADEIRGFEETARSTGARLSQIEDISRKARNDASLHTSAHKASANITDLTGKTSSDVERAENQTAENLSNMGYDIALQKWRNGDISQTQFDRILKEHLDVTREQKDRYAEPDTTKGYTKTPEYRNGGRPAPTSHDERHDDPDSGEHDDPDGGGHDDHEGDDRE